MSFRVKSYNPNAPISVSTPRTVAPRSTAVSDFKKSIKRDKSHYTVLREDKQWDAWKRSTLATARSHSCEEIFNPSYVPSNSDERDLFHEKQKFIYSVFEEKLQTDIGKSLVHNHDHEHDSDAQTIFANCHHLALLISSVFTTLVLLITSKSSSCTNNMFPIHLLHLLSLFLTCHRHLMTLQLLPPLTADLIYLLVQLSSPPLLTLVTYMSHTWPTSAS